MSQEQKKPTPGRAITLSLLSLISLALLTAGVLTLLLAMLAPMGSSDPDRQAVSYVGGLYYLFMTWTLFGVAGLLQAYISAERRGWFADKTPPPTL